MLRRHARRLRQLANSDEIVGIERAAAVDQVVADLGPRETDGGIADVVAHAGRARREDGEVGAALALKCQLQLQALANLRVADVEARARRRPGCILPAGDLVLPKSLELPRRRRVVAVTIDDHDALTGRWLGPDKRGGDRPCRGAEALQRAAPREVHGSCRKRGLVQAAATERPSCSHVLATSLTVARCTSRRKRRSSNAVPRCMVQRSSHITRSLTRQRWV